MLGVCRRYMLGFLPDVPLDASVELCGVGEDGRGK